MGQKSWTKTCARRQRNLSSPVGEDNASYHHQHNTEYFPEGTTPKTASKGLNAHVLRELGVTSIKVPREGGEKNFYVPADEPPDVFNHRTKVPGAKVPRDGAPGSVYCRSGDEGPSSSELAEAVTAICKADHPYVLDSKVEKLFREKGWKIIWTPPYCPKFQPIGLVWGVGKQRAGTLYFRGRDLQTTREHLRRGFYGGKGSGTKKFEPCNVRGCWETALSEMAHWIATDVDHNPGGGATPEGVSGALGEYARGCRLDEIRRDLPRHPRDCRR